MDSRDWKLGGDQCLLPMEIEKAVEFNRWLSTATARYALETENKWLRAALAEAGRAVLCLGDQMPANANRPPALETAINIHLARLMAGGR